MTITITLIIIIITCLVSISAFNNHKLIHDLVFYPPAVSKQGQWYRFFTCGFIHADFIHLAFNMFSLYMFGVFVEAKFVDIFGNIGKMLYLLMYVLALPVCLLPTYAKNKENYQYRSLGASGAVSAVIFAGLMIAPYVEVGLFFIPPFIPGFVFAPLFIILSFYLEKRGKDNVNHSAHIWGALFGLAFIIAVGKLVGDYNAITEFVNGVKYYFRAKGL